MWKLDVFNEYEKDSATSVDYSWFLHIWQEDFEHVRIPAAKRLGTCDDCKESHDNICATLDPDKRAIWKAKQRAHAKFYKGERLVYHENRVKSRAGDCLCVILDGYIPLIYFVFLVFFLCKVDPAAR